MSELKPCPFCGEQFVVDIDGESGGVAVWHNTNGKKCPFSEIEDATSFLEVGDNISVLEDLLNTRPVEDALRAENERLRKALEEIANHSWYPELNYGVTIFDPHWYEGKYYDFKDIAREALEVKG